MLKYRVFVRYIVPLLCFGLLLAVQNASASPVQANKLMRTQVDAVVAKDHAAFIKHGNRAFKEMMDAWTFDSIVMQRQAKLAKGYKLEHLGVITRLGMQEHVWRVLPNDYKYQFLGRLSLADGKVVGFMLE